jgi:predicted short-subunit dehydrogenase-like oxidoreductase (DUF2520 family)
MENQSGAPAALTIVGPGRAGNSIAAAARSAGIDVAVAGRSFEADAVSRRCVLLCVPDSEIPSAVAALVATGGTPDALGHVSGATTLEPLAGAGTSAGTFSMHPLQTIPRPDTDLAGAHAAVSGSSPEMISLATGLAGSIGMHAFHVREPDRAVYHAAASIASNFLVTLEQSAADLLAGIGVDQPRDVLAPLVSRSLENWIAAGPDALTGPIARGDRVTVDRHREALRDRSPGLVTLYDALAERTTALVTAVEVRG